MATPIIVADFESQLSTAVAVGATTFSLTSATDDDGIALPNGLYYFTVDNGTSAKEYLAGTLAGTSVTGVVSVSRQGAETSGAVRKHRIGATVIMTDFASYVKYMNGIALVSAPDASTTAKGVVETATLAEVRAGTATGSTGAKLAVTPDVLTDMTSQTEKAALVGDIGTPSSTNKFKLQNKSITAGETISGATLPVPVYQSSSTGKYLACQSSVLTKLAFQGFATSSSADTNPMNVQFEGIVSGFSGLTTGLRYYVQDTVGTISTTPGTYEILVGVAVSTTQVLILKGKRTASGTLTVSGTGTTVITVGFRVNKVRVHAILNYSGTFVSTSLIRSDGGWTLFGGQRCVFVSTVSNGGNIVIGIQATNYCYQLESQTGTQGQYGQIITVTDTTFTISNTQTNSATAGLIFWEAEGDL